MHTETLIIGIGNTLRRDDGFGPAVLDMLEAEGVPGSVKLMAVHQLTPELAENLMGVDRVVFVDASVMDWAVGPGIRFEPVQADGPTGDAISHNFPPSALLQLMRMIGGRPPEAWTLSAPASDLEAGEGLSPACQAYAHEAVKLLRDWLEQGGRDTD